MDPQLLEKLKELLPVMRDCGVQSLSYQGLELVFRSEPVAASSAPAVAATPEKASVAPAAAPSLTTEKIEDVLVTQSPEEEEKMDFEKVLHWSSPDSNEGSVPLTNDQPLSPDAAVPLEVNRGA